MFPRLGDEDPFMFVLDSDSGQKGRVVGPTLGVDEEVISMAAARRPAKSGTKKPRAHKASPKRPNGKSPRK
jgi:hypothetical protein